MRTALVTGGAGFIGSHLARRLLQDGWSVHVVDNLSTGYRENVPEGAEFHLVDLSHDGFVGDLPQGSFDAVFHVAAQSSGEISFDDPVYDLKTNCLSTLMLLDWCREAGVPRFLYTSSMSIYGDQETQPVKEDAVPRPKSHYGVGKLASEGYVGVYGGIGLATTSLRLFNVYGPGQNLANLRQGMVSIYLAYVLAGEELHVKGSPGRFRDLVHVDDVVEAYMTCLDDPASHGRTYNVAQGEKVTVEELVRSLLVTFGHDPEAYPVRYEGSTPGDTFGIWADVSLIREELGWEAKTGLEDGLARMVEWARTQAVSDEGPQ